MNAFTFQVADVGVETFNNDHQRLLFYVSEFSRLARRFRDREPQEDEWDQVGGLFPRLEKYALIHFTAEEEMMRVHGYPHWQEHARQHDQLRERIPVLKAGIADRERGRIAELEDFLLDWLTTHINREDLKYKGFFQLEESREVLDKALFNEMISVDQLHLVVEAAPEGTVILDIRTGIEHREGVIPGARLFPCDHNLENRQDLDPFKISFAALFDPGRFDPTLRYILICRSGPRTEIALEAFLDGGLKACELIGGVEEWKRQGYPLVSPED